jgi:hypothetical protein
MTATSTHRTTSPPMVRLGKMPNARELAKDNELRTAGQQAERQRMADYYARTTKDQEERENAEARERFLEQQQRLTVNRPIKP